MSTTPNGDAAIIVNFAVVVITFLLSLCTALFFFVLRRIKKNIDDLWSKLNADHDRITVIETKCSEKNGG